MVTFQTAQRASKHALTQRVLRSKQHTAITFDARARAVFMMVRRVNLRVLRFITIASQRRCVLSAGAQATRVLSLCATSRSKKKGYGFFPAVTSVERISWSNLGTDSRTVSGKQGCTQSRSDARFQFWKQKKPFCVRRGTKE